MVKDNIKEVSKKLQNISIKDDHATEESFDPNAESEPDTKDHFFVHIDILNNSRTSENMPLQINKFMIRRDSYSPKTFFNFPSTVLKEHENIDTVSDARLRTILGISDSYYEFWRVNSNKYKSRYIEKFISNLVTEPQVKVRVITIKNNEHYNRIYSTMSLDNYLAMKGLQPVVRNRRTKQEIDRQIKNINRQKLNN